MKLVGWNTHFLVFFQNFKFLFHPKLRVFKGNEIKFNEIVTKTPKISLYFNILFLKNRGCKDLI